MLMLNGFDILSRIISNRDIIAENHRWKGSAMRSEHEVNHAIEQHSDMVLRLCMVSLKNTADAEDVFQNVFLKYTLSDQVFETEEHEKAWLIRVTVNACRDVLKSFFRKHTVSLDEVSDFLSQSAPEQRSLLEAVRSLPKNYREVIYLHYYEGYTAPEIAGILHKNPNTVYTHLSRAREMLKEMLGGEAVE